MYEQATVLTIENHGHVTVSCKTDSCANCKASSFCAAKERIFVADNVHDLNLHPGETVELYLPPMKTIWAGFITLLVPLLLFPVGYYFPLLFIEAPDEGTKIIGGIGGIAVGFLLARIFSRRKGYKYLPHIVRVVSTEITGEKVDR